MKHHMFRGLGCGHHEASIFNQSTHIPCICLHTWLLIQFNYFLRNYFYAILFWREHISGHIVPLQRAFICSDISTSCCHSVTDYPTLSNPMDCSTIDLNVLHYLWSLLKLMSTESVMRSNPLILCHPLLLWTSIFLSISVSSIESAVCIRQPKDWSFSFSISPSNEYLGLISFRINWFEFLAVQSLSRVFSRTTVQKHQLFGPQPSLWSNSHICTWLLEKN